MFNCAHGKKIQESWKPPQKTQNVLDMFATSSILRANDLERTRTKFCSELGKTSSHGNLGLAIKECQRKDKCVGIYDQDCDGNGEFELCEGVKNISNGVMLASCIYTKDPGKSKKGSIIIQTRGWQ